MSFILGIVIFSVGGMLGLFMGCAFALSSRFDMMDELDDAHAEIERLRGRG
jgi:hypothetical protein